MLTRELKAKSIYSNNSFLKLNKNKDFHPMLTSKKKERILHFDNNMEKRKNTLCSKKERNKEVEGL